MNGVPAAAQPASDDGMSSTKAEEIQARPSLLDNSSAEFLAAVPTSLIQDDLELFSDGAYRPMVPPQAVFPSTGGEDQIMNGSGTSTPRRQRELEDAPQRAVSPRLEGGREIANATVNAVHIVAPAAAVYCRACSRSCHSHTHSTTRHCRACSRSCHCRTHSTTRHCRAYSTN